MGLHLIINPIGTYSFVGSVPVYLGWTNKDGTELSTDQAIKLKYAQSPALIAKSRSFKTVQDAIDFASEQGFEIDSLPTLL